MSGRKSSGRKGHGHKDPAAGSKPAPARPAAHTAAQEAAEDAAEGPNSLTGDKIRLDKWLFFARFFKTRGLASDMISKGRLRVNGQRQSKPGHAVAPGDVLTFVCGNQTRVIRLLSPGTRRGPATEAQTLYLDLDPPTGSDTNTETAANPAADPDGTASPLE